MIEKIILSVNEDKPPQIITWSENCEDYIIEGVSGLTRDELIQVVDEIKRLTNIEDC